MSQRRTKYPTKLIPVTLPPIPRLRLKNYPDIHKDDPRRRLFKADKDIKMTFADKNRPVGFYKPPIMPSFYVDKSSCIGDDVTCDKRGASSAVDSRVNADDDTKSTRSGEPTFNGDTLRDNYDDFSLDSSSSAADFRATCAVGERGPEAPILMASAGSFIKRGDEIPTTWQCKKNARKRLSASTTCTNDATEHVVKLTPTQDNVISDIQKLSDQGLSTKWKKKKERKYKQRSFSPNEDADLDRKNSDTGYSTVGVDHNVPTGIDIPDVNEETSIEGSNRMTSSPTYPRTAEQTCSSKELHHRKDHSSDSYSNVQSIDPDYYPEMISRSPGMKFDSHSQHRSKSRSRSRNLQRSRSPSASNCNFYDSESINADMFDIHSREDAQKLEMELIENRKGTQHKVEWTLLPDCYSPVNDLYTSTSKSYLDCAMDTQPLKCQSNACSPPDSALLLSLNTKKTYLHKIFTNDKLDESTDKTHSQSKKRRKNSKLCHSPIRPENTTASINEFDKRFQSKRQRQSLNEQSIMHDESSSGSLGISATDCHDNDSHHTAKYAKTNTSMEELTTLPSEQTTDLQRKNLQLSPIDRLSSSCQQELPKLDDQSMKVTSQNDTLNIIGNSPLEKNETAAKLIMEVPELYGDNNNRKIVSPSLYKNKIKINFSNKNRRLVNGTCAIGNKVKVSPTNGNLSPPALSKSSVPSDTETSTLTSKNNVGTLKIVDDETYENKTNLNEDIEFEKGLNETLNFCISSTESAQTTKFLKDLPELPDEQIEVRRTVTSKRLPQTANFSKQKKQVHAAVKHTFHSKRSFPSDIPLVSEEESLTSEQENEEEGHETQTEKSHINASGSVNGEEVATNKIVPDPKSTTKPTQENYDECNSRTDWNQFNLVKTVINNKDIVIVDPSAPRKKCGQEYGHMNVFEKLLTVKPKMAMKNKKHKPKSYLQMEIQRRMAANSQRTVVNENNSGLQIEHKSDEENKITKTDEATENKNKCTNLNNDKMGEELQTDNEEIRTKETKRKMKEKLKTLFSRKSVCQKIVEPQKRKMSSDSCVSESYSTGRETPDSTRNPEIYASRCMPMNVVIQLCKMETVTTSDLENNVEEASAATNVNFGTDSSPLSSNVTETGEENCTITKTTALTISETASHSNVLQENDPVNDTLTGSEINTTKDIYNSNSVEDKENVTPNCDDQVSKNQEKYLENQETTNIPDNDVDVRELSGNVENSCIDKDFSQNMNSHIKKKIKIITLFDDESGSPMSIEEDMTSISTKDKNVDEENVDEENDDASSVSSDHTVINMSPTTHEFHETKAISEEINKEVDERAKNIEINNLRESSKKVENTLLTTMQIKGETVRNIVIKEKPSLLTNSHIDPEIIDLVSDSEEEYNMEEETSTKVTLELATTTTADREIENAVLPMLPETTKSVIDSNEKFEVQTRTSPVTTLITSTDDVHTEMPVISTKLDSILKNDIRAQTMTSPITELPTLVDKAESEATSISTTTSMKLSETVGTAPLPSTEKDSTELQEATVPITSESISTLHDTEVHTNVNLPTPVTISVCSVETPVATFPIPPEPIIPEHDIEVQARADLVASVTASEAEVGFSTDLAPATFEVAVHTNDMEVETRSNLLMENVESPTILTTSKTTDFVDTAHIQTTTNSPELVTSSSTELQTTILPTIVEEIMSSDDSEVQEKSDPLLDTTEAWIEKMPKTSEIIHATDAVNIKTPTTSITTPSTDNSKGQQKTIENAIPNSKNLLNQIPMKTVTNVTENDAIDLRVADVKERQSFGVPDYVPNYIENQSLNLASNQIDKSIKINREAVMPLKVFIKEMPTLPVTTSAKNVNNLKTVEKPNNVQFNTGTPTFGTTQPPPQNMTYAPKPDTQSNNVKPMRIKKMKLSEVLTQLLKILPQLRQYYRCMIQQQLQYAHMLITVMAMYFMLIRELKGQKGFVSLQQIMEFVARYINEEINPQEQFTAEELLLYLKYYIGLIIDTQQSPESSIQSTKQQNVEPAVSTAIPSASPSSTQSPTQQQTSGTFSTNVPKKPTTSPYQELPSSTIRNNNISRRGRRKASDELNNPYKLVGKKNNKAKATLNTNIEKSNVLSLEQVKLLIVQIMSYYLFNSFAISPELENYLQKLKNAYENNTNVQHSGIQMNVNKANVPCFCVHCKRNAFANTTNFQTVVHQQNNGSVYANVNATRNQINQQASSQPKVSASIPVVQHQVPRLMNPHNNFNTSQMPLQPMSFRIPLQQMPLQQTQLQHVPLQQTLLQQVPLQQSQLQQVSLQQTQLQQVPLQQTQLQQMPLQQAMLHQVPLQRSPLQQVPLQQMSLQKVPLQQTPLQQVPLRQTSLQQAPLQQMPLQQVPLQQTPLQQMQSMRSTNFITAQRTSAQPSNVTTNTPLQSALMSRINVPLHYSQSMPAQSTITPTYTAAQSLLNVTTSNQNISEVQINQDNSFSKTAESVTHSQFGVGTPDTRITQNIIPPPSYANSVKGKTMQKSSPDSSQQTQHPEPANSGSASEKQCTAETAQRNQETISTKSRISVVPEQQLLRPEVLERLTSSTISHTTCDSKVEDRASEELDEQIKTDDDILEIVWEKMITKGLKTEILESDVTINAENISAVEQLVREQNLEELLRITESLNVTIEGTEGQITSETSGLVSNTNPEDAVAARGTVPLSLAHQAESVTTAVPENAKEMSEKSENATDLTDETKVDLEKEESTNSAVNKNAELELCSSLAIVSVTSISHDDFDKQTANTVGLTEEMPNTQPNIKFWDQTVTSTTANEESFPNENGAMSDVPNINTIINNDTKGSIETNANEEINYDRVEYDEDDEDMMTEPCHLCDKPGRFGCSCGRAFYCTIKCKELHWEKQHGRVCLGPPEDLI